PIGPVLCACQEPASHRADAYRIATKRNYLLIRGHSLALISGVCFGGDLVGMCQRFVLSFTRRKAKGRLIVHCSSKLFLFEQSPYRHKTRYSHRVWIAPVKRCCQATLQPTTGSASGTYFS